MGSDNDALSSLRLGEVALRAVLEGLPDATVGATRDGTIVFVNALAESQFGYRREDLIGRPIELLWPQRVRDRYRRNMELYFTVEHPLSFTERAYGLRRDGSEFVGEMSWGIVVAEGGPLLLAVGRDISERLAAEQRLRRRSEQQAAIAALGERALSGVGPIDLSRQAAERVATTLAIEHVAVLEAEAGDRPAGSVASWGDPVKAGSEITVAIQTGRDVHGALLAQAAREEAFTAEDSAFITAAANVLATAHARQQNEQWMRHQALHDPLTGLANRALCRDRITHALAHAERAGSVAAVMFVDVDNFKHVNDLFGHAAGDQLLIALARRMSAAVRPADTVARLGGDEFVVVCEGVDERTALALGSRVAAAVQETINAGGSQHNLSASVGIALGSAASTDPDVLVGHADAAAYRAKQLGIGGVEIFDEGMRRRALDRLRTESDLEGALERGELELVFQPIVSLADRAAVAHESLLRWRRVGQREIDPAEFIPVAEESGLIIPIGSWVLEHACHRAAEMTRAKGTPDHWVSVNLSARQIAAPDLLEVVTASLEASGLAPSSLGVEVTETVLLHVTPAIVTNLQNLKTLGVRLVLDDFGAGYSSFRHLKDFPIDLMKIDRSFVANLARSRQDAAIVASVISMATALGLDVVAEGVENESQAALLRELACPMAQGFLFGPPA
ncbi:MAG: EAL domain-containing protein [Solirubrobacterales bacterium]|nr:EAL domain-containing protein [Solirubrobacterales bacterium]